MATDKAILAQYWDLGRQKTGDTKQLDRLLNENAQLESPHIADFYKRSADKASFIRSCTKFDRAGEKATQSYHVRQN